MPECPNWAERALGIGNWAWGMAECPNARMPELGRKGMGNWLCFKIAEKEYFWNGGVTIIMALTGSTMLSLGTEAPDFQLPDVVSGETISLSTFTDKKALLVMFICRHCPFVKHVQSELAQLGKDYLQTDLGIVAISANDVENFADDAPDLLKKMATELDFKFAFCYDETQETAKSYTAACTPDFFLFDDRRKLFYRGQLDDSRPSNGKPVTGKDLRSAIDSVLAGKSFTEEQKPSIGCNIKWKPGSEPDYFG